MRRIAIQIALVAAAFVTQACIIREPVAVNAGYAYGYGPQPLVRAPMAQSVSSYYVGSPPPEPLYETMTPSPGSSYAWIDGSWHWNGYEWVWVAGRWEQNQSGYVYVQPYYTLVDGAYVYTPGYWSRPDKLPSGWHGSVRVQRDGRPAIVAPPPTWHPPTPANQPPRQPIGVRPPTNNGIYAPGPPPLSRPIQPGRAPSTVNQPEPPPQPPHRSIPGPAQPPPPVQPPPTYHPAPAPPPPPTPTYHPAPAPPPPPEKPVAPPHKPPQPVHNPAQH